MPRTQVVSILFLLILSLFSCQGNSDEGPDKKPNIFFIFADDMTYAAVHALGYPEVRTPNLDRLVEGGVTFTHAYNMGGWNGAICMASRAMIISGRSLWRAHAFDENWKNGDSLELSWPKLMEQAGYDTYMTGKWHVQAPADEIFQVARHIRPGMPGDTEAGYNRPQGPGEDTWSPSDTAFGGFWEGGTHWSEVVANDAIEYLDRASRSEKPFFMYLAFNAPHDPRQSPQRFVDMYPLDNVSVPESFLPLNPWMDPMGCPATLRDERLAPFPRTEYAVKVHRQEYYAIITHMDEQIGRMLDKLEAEGMMANTYIFFTADHGLSVGQHGLLGKQSMYDHSLRVPLMIHGPGMPAGKRVDADIYLQDLMPTALELAGQEIPEYVDFHSLTNLAREEKKSSPYPAVYGAYTLRQRMIRKDNFKLVAYPEAGKLLLFDLEADPHEMNDLSDDPDYRDKVAELFEELIEWQEHYRDTLDLVPAFGDPSRLSG